MQKHLFSRFRTGLPFAINIIVAIQLAESIGSIGEAARQDKQEGACFTCLTGQRNTLVYS